MAKKDAHGFELDKNDFVMLTKSNAELAQKKVDGSPKEVNEKKLQKYKKLSVQLEKIVLSKMSCVNLFKKKQR